MSPLGYTLMLRHVHVQIGMKGRSRTFLEIVRRNGVGNSYM